MKKSVFINRSIQLLCLVMFMFLVSCKKNDGLNSKELLIYVPGEYGSVNSSINLPLTHTPLSVWGNTSLDIPVYATREVEADITAYIFPDTLVSQYNQNNGTNYSLLPASAYKIVNDNKHTIPAGKVVSDPLKIQITDATLLTDPKGYVLPLTITRLETSDKGARISSNQATVFVTLPYVYTNVDSTQTATGGTLMARTAWAVTVSNSSSGTANQASNMLDGNNTTVWRSSNSATAAKTITLNLGSSLMVKGFRITPNYTNTGENATQLTVSTSDDNVTYTVQGIWKGTGPSASSSATAPDIKGINLIVPVTAKYFKFDITAWVSTNVVGVAEVNAVQ